MTLLQPQIPGGRRVMPVVVDDAAVTHLRELLEQDRAWVLRSRWGRWLAEGDLDDTVPIAALPRDDRRAARAWLRQQRHVLHRVVVGDGQRAPSGWLGSLPLYRALDD